MENRGIVFKKMHGTGNDFIVIKYEDFPFEERFKELAQKTCHRHFGIGADGLLIVNKSNIADFKMQYYNSDGSLAAMCGNGIRCFAKFVYDEGLINKSLFTVETLSGVKKVSLNIDDDKTKSVKVNMGEVIFEPSKIPVTSEKASFINETIMVNDRNFTVTTVLMGVPHTVIFTDTLNLEEIKAYGPLIEKHDIYPANTNVSFAKIRDEGNIEVRTWERGAGYTLACGTGVSSVVGVAYRLGLVDNKVNINTEGGNIKIEVMEDDSVFMDGPAQDICSGVYFI
ncbi:diaminopimelate epimerase [Alkaliphilus flagellatus]|uniref:diaminopimelate epimerase n=1 Tax=Alkaliphilus flagellatus TaxID=2841507 RepID=UPI001FE27014|nr:diaminopimelate epimerase [Alkaliphilus flagellatus]